MAISIRLRCLAGQKAALVTAQRVASSRLRLTGSTKTVLSRLSKHRVVIL